LRAGVIGGGSWGTALAGVLADAGHDVLLWSRDEDVARGLNEAHRNPRYLKGIPIPERVRGTTSLPAALEGAELIVTVAPSHVTRQIIQEAAPHLPPNVPICCATKGIEVDTLMTMSEVLEDVLPPERHPYLSFLSGPSFAEEVARNLPTNVVVAARWERMAHFVQKAFARPTFRVYTSTDVIGVELGGAMKNVIAIAAGASDGLGFGHNALAGLITRGLAEIGRLAAKRGAHPMTLSGLAGLGDLILTCTGELSRNRQVGFRLGKGERIEEILGSMSQVAEGVKTAKSAHDLARRLQVDLPITDAVYSALYEGVSARDAVRNLLARELKAEFPG
jgi:glycerol-3-phosphate dehydrogenase (NAD(P)+)